MQTIQLKQQTIKSEQTLRAAGLGTFKCRINVTKVDQDGKYVVPRSALLGIARKLINLDKKRDHPQFSKFFRSKEVQSFEADLNGKSYLLSQNLPSGYWVCSDN